MSATRGRYVTGRRKIEVLEDVSWLLSWGETYAPTIAARVDMSEAALYRFLGRLAFDGNEDAARIRTCIEWPHKQGGGVRG